MRRLVLGSLYGAIFLMAAACDGSQANQEDAKLAAPAPQEELVKFPPSDGNPGAPNRTEVDNRAPPTDEVIIPQDEGQTEAEEAAKEQVPEENPCELAKFDPLRPECTGYELTFEDEFSGTTLDATQWAAAPEWFRQGGCYWAADHHELTGTGTLRLKISESQDTVYCGAIRTHKLFDQKFGYFEVRSTTPQIRGGWAAFWMMPYKNEVGQQGRDGTEIDIFETINGWNQKLNHALHWDGYAASQQSAKQHMTERADIYDGGYHTFGLLWTATEYVFYVDGLETWRTSAGGVSQVKEYLKLTMEVSSQTWPGDWQDQVEKPIYWDIDYVRAYQLSE